MVQRDVVLREPTKNLNRNNLDHFVNTYRIPRIHVYAYTFDIINQFIS